MADWSISTTGVEALPARRLAHGALRDAIRCKRRMILAEGTSPPRLAAIAETLLGDHQVVLVPAPRPAALPEALRLIVSDDAVVAAERAGGPVRAGWNLAMFTSGSTRTPRPYGFTSKQLETVTGWYRQIYQATADSVIVTSLPVTYNFTFVAGVLLAARLGARLHLSATPERALHDASRLAGFADRVIVLANPVMLDHAEQACPPLPATVLIDSGGAPLSIPAINGFRDAGIDLREGYGLTETASLTHFDTEGTTASVGTVGIAMPGVGAGVELSSGKPVLEIASPAIGMPIDPRTPPSDRPLRTTDLAQIDTQGRLRLLGRIDDEPINDRWPRDTLDAIGVVLGRRCALVRHPSPQSALIRLATWMDAADVAVVRTRASEYLGIPPDAITIDHRGELLHSAKLLRDA